jgi:hypothetical protein
VVVVTLFFLPNHPKKCLATRKKDLTFDAESVIVTASKEKTSTLKEETKKTS